MSCDAYKDDIGLLASGDLDADSQRRLLVHIDGCDACRMAMRGAEALVELASRETPRPRAGLFDEIVDRTVAAPPVERTHFWRGAGFGALAASILAAALLFTWPDSRNGHDIAVDAPQFVVSLEEARPMSLAFETDRALTGATITILLSGDVEIDGYGPQRELSWAEDLDAGVNRLSLPLIANGLGGGQMVVRLEHPDSSQMFVVQLPVDSAYGAEDDAA